MASALMKLETPANSSPAGMVPQAGQESLKAVVVLLKFLPTVLGTLAPPQHYTDKHGAFCTMTIAQETKGVGVLVARRSGQLRGFGTEKTSMLVCSPEQMEYSNENKNKNKRSVYWQMLLSIYIPSYSFWLTTPS